MGPIEGLRAKKKQEEHKETAPNIKEITTLLYSEYKSDTNKIREDIPEVLNRHT
ncbi:MAG: hypothetical protein ACFFDF_22520 [Candidatus Odinarchaeota archaeon]